MVGRVCSECGGLRAFFVHFLHLSETNSPARLCKTCKSTDHVDTRQALCMKCLEEIPTVGKKPRQASFGFEVGKRLWCRTHAPTGAGNVSKAPCEHQGCSIQPSYGFEHDRKSRWCRNHKAVGAIDLISKLCEYGGCSIQPVYGYKKEAKRRWCRTHSPSDTVNLLAGTCENVDCDIEPNFGLESEGKRRWCGAHKVDVAVDVTSKRCEFLGCSIIPCFGLKADGVRRWCQKHSREGAVALGGKRCEYPECENRPVFGQAEDGIIRWCGDHKMNGSSDLMHAQCEHSGCGVRPLYGLLSESLGRWCLTHGPTDKVFVGKDCCVVCKKRPGSLVSLNTEGLLCASCLTGKVFGASAISLEWLGFIAAKDNVNIQTALHSHGEKRVEAGGKRYKVDGFCQETRTVYEFHGCLYHSCEMCYPDRTALNSILKRPHHIVWKKTVEKREAIMAAGYNYVEILECVWKQSRKALLGLTAKGRECYG